MITLPKFNVEKVELGRPPTAAEIEPLIGQMTRLIEQRFPDRVCGAYIAMLGCLLSGLNHDAIEDINTIAGLVRGPWRVIPLQ